MRIYIAAPLSDKDKTDRNPSKVVTDYIQNLHRMCKIASEVRKKGHAPYIPGIDFLVGVIAGDWEEDDYRNTSMEFLLVCDAILVVRQSWGVVQETKIAKKAGLVVFYSLEEIPKK